MKGSPLVSVIIPTYNRALLLPRAVDSALAQTYGNVEIVVVDDGSTDSTQAVLDGYGDRIRRIRTENGGASNARNVGMRASSGRYIAFLDSDDSYYPYKLSIQVEWMERHPAVGLVSTEVSAVQDDGTVQENHLRRYHPVYDERGWGFGDLYPEREEFFFADLGRTATCYSGDIFDYCLSGTLVMTNTVLFRREALEVAGYQNEAYRFAEDYEFVLRLCKHFRAGFIDVPTYKLHYHDGQISRFLTKTSLERGKDDRLMAEGLSVMLAAVEDSAYADPGYYPTHKKRVDERMSELNAEIGSLWCKCGDPRKGREHLRKSYRIAGKRFPVPRSWIVSAFPERYLGLLRNMRDRIAILCMLLALALIGPLGFAASATIHVDPSIAADCPVGYDPANRTCGGGTSIAYRTLGGAAAAARPGDTVLLREGSYREVLSPQRSGTAGNAIAFKGFPGETATLTGVDQPAILLKNLSWLIVEGLTVTDVPGWGRIEGSNDITIRNNRFAGATARGTTGGLKFVRSARNRILNNTFEEGNDSLVLQESDRNLVQGNAFTSARHSLLSIRCGNYNVIRGNRFENEYQKAAEVYDCEGVSDAPVKLDATKHNLFEGNAFLRTRGSGKDYRYNGIQYGGQDGIVRRNVFRGNEGGALNFQVYPREALYNSGNHVFHNTFYDNRCYGIGASAGSGGGRYSGNVVKNNIFYKNTDCAGRPEQLSIGNAKAVKLEGNAILAASPGFVDEAGNDLRLTAGSPMIDAGAFATRAVGAGSGEALKVEDAGYFYDGFGIPGESGDLIRLEGGGPSARIVRIDHAGKTLLIDRPIAWEGGQRLHLEYSGIRPDPGAFEFSSK